MFSETVDAIVARSGKLNRIGDIIKYTNATIREQNGKHFFVRDLIEDQLTADAEPYTWTHPNAYRKMRTVRYPAGEVEYPPRLSPGKIQKDEDYLYYDASSYTVFKGVGNGGIVNVAYYQWLTPLKYYKKLDDTRAFIAAYEAVVGELEVRPALYDETTNEWTYLLNGAYVSTLGSTALDEAAQAKVSNWLLNRWQATIEEGGLAKILKSLDDSRAVSTFALYKSMEQQIETNEIYESLDY